MLLYKRKTITTVSFMANVRVQNIDLKNKGGGNCHNCGTSHPPKCCPAYGKTCYNCNKKGHFKPLCRRRQCS